MIRSLKSVLVLAAAIGLYQVVAVANGSSPAPRPGGATSMPSMSPEERAIEAYRTGDEHRVKGRKFENEAITKEGKSRDDAAKKAKSEFEKAFKDYKGAAQLNPNLFQAYNGMGYSYRKLGAYPQALEMYDKAIAMAPGFFAEAVEYRAEAYLALNRIDDARKAYLDLFAADRKQADELMVAMKDWAAKRKVDPAGADPAAVAGFEKWLGERGEIAKDSQLMALSGSQKRW
jgi:tetratricopeptide (TPR) repeat protein